LIETTRRGLAAFGTSLLAVPALAQSGGAVRVGATYPLSGAVASAGTALCDALEVAVDIVNNPHPELGKLPLAATAGLPGLGGRKVEVVFADHQGNPAVAQSQTVRLITQEKVVGPMANS
jgi:branched-chain amino acid transport system substrate-binding protein